MNVIITVLVIFIYASAIVLAMALARMSGYWNRIEEDEANSKTNEKHDIDN